MENINEAVTARLKKGNEVFEILVDCEKALLFRENKASIDDALIAEDIFKDIKKGFHASENEIEKLFQTKDIRKVAEKIIKEGEIQLSTEYKNKLREEKKKQIINLIHVNTINPQNGFPHPIERIKLALEQAKVSINEFKKAEDQFQDIVKKINVILPIKIEKRDLQIIIPAKFSSPCYGIIKKLTDVKKEEWLNNGSLSIKVEIPAGIQEELENQLNKITHGDLDIKILERI